MHYKLFGRSGLRVAEVALGTMTFGTEWGFGSEKEECRRVFDTYIEAGGNFLDTANHYTNGTSEEWLGEFVREDRHRYVVATKYTLSHPLNDPNSGGNHRKSLVRALEGSLRRLNTDYIDVLWVHAWDYITPADEIMRALDDVVRAGKVLYIGVSDAPAWAVARSNAIAELRGWTAFAGLQLQYSLIERNIERELIPLARATDLAVCVWGAIAAGVLSGKYMDGEPEVGRFKGGSQWARFSGERVKDIVRTAVDAAKELGCTPAQLAFAWTMKQDERIIPIIGARTAAQLAESLKCLDLTIPAEIAERLETVSKIDMGFPHNFLEVPEIRSIVYGGTYDRLKIHRPVR